MRAFTVTSPDRTILMDLQHHIDTLAKPKGSLGSLEKIACQIGWHQQTLYPILKQPHHLLFAADHGIADSNVSPSPKSITWQQTLNFLHGGGGINLFTRQHNIKLNIIDVGVDYNFDPNLPLFHYKIRQGTRNFLYRAAMTKVECDHAIDIGASMVELSYQSGCNIISFGELGIANTSASSIWMHFLTGIPLQECVGAGSGWKDAGIQHKYQVLQQAVNHYLKVHPDDMRTAKNIMSYFGGYEMVACVGGMLRAAELGMTIVIDGFIMTLCVLMASQFAPNIIDYAIFAHEGDEMGHKRVLHYMGKEGLLHLHFRLGEGTGAVCAYPLLCSAVNMLTQMKSFAEAEVDPIKPC